MRYLSKRNEVLLQNGRVIKKLRDEHCAKFEANMLRYLRANAVNVARVIDVCGNEVALEYVKGQALPDYLETEIAGKQFDSLKLAVALCDWFSAFYAAVDLQPDIDRSSKQIRGDVNGRNFIVSKEPEDGLEVIGVDFEERCFGRRETDLGRLIAFILTYEIVGAKDLLRGLANTLREQASLQLGMSADEIDKQCVLELKAIKARRR